MKLIPLTKGYSAIVSNEDFPFLNTWKWHYNNGYAERQENGRHIMMHKVLLPGNHLVDHINGNKLDNTRANLRAANKSTNAMNMRKHRGASVYKGVSRQGKLWRVQIWKDNKRVFSESAPTEQLAGMIYDLNATLVFGEYARLNF